MLGLTRTKPTPPAPAPRRPSPGEQCTGTAKAGKPCTQWGKHDGRCHLHPHPPKPAPEPAALTAAVSVVQMDSASWQTWKFGSREWQTEAWRLYDITGQLRFVANWVGASVSRCRLYVADVDDSGEAGDETKDAAMAQLASGPLGNGPAKDEALRLLGVNLFIAGEAYVIAEADALEDGEDRWFVVSGRHIRRQGGEIIIRRSQLHGGGDMIYREGVDLIIRVWTPHPADTDEPDSPTRSAIPDLREIEAIRKREFAELDSRLAGAGILPLPEGIQFPRGDKDPPGVEGFMALLQRTMSMSLSDRGSAETMVPIMFTVPPETLGKIAQVTFWSELSDQLLPMKEAAVKSLAQSLDIPPEILTGQADSNHWSAWAIGDDAIQTQIKPVNSRIEDALTGGFLRRALEFMGRDPDSQVYVLDTSSLTAKPDRTADALTYHGARLLSDEAAVDAGAFAAEDLPSDEERLRRIIEDAVASNAALLDDPIVRKIIGMEASPAPVVVDGGEDGNQPPTPPPPAEDPKAIPDEEQKPAKPKTTPPKQQQSQALLPTIYNISNMVMRRALRVAGTRLVPHGQRLRYPKTSHHQLHAVLGETSCDDADRALRGAWTDLPAAAEDIDVDPIQWEELLHSFAKDLLTRGMAYDGRLLRDSLEAALRDRRLDTMADLIGAAA